MYDSKPTPRRDVTGPQPVLSPALRRLLGILGFALALLAANSLYLVAVRLAGIVGRAHAETPFSLGMFLFHVLLGLAVLLPFAYLVVAHGRRGWAWPNRRAAAMGLALAAVSFVIAATGILLTRVENVIELRDPATRRLLFWLHIVSPLVAGWLYLLHRRRGRPLAPGQLRRWVLAAAGPLRARRGRSSRRRAPAARGGAGGRQPELLPVARSHADGETPRCRRVHGRCLLPAVPCRHARELVDVGAPLQLVQQPGVQVLGSRDAARLGRTRRRPQGLALVRRLPRPGAVLQRQVRPHRLRHRPRSDGARRPDLHELPRDPVDRLGAWQRRLHDRRARALSVRFQRQRDVACAG